LDLWIKFGKIISRVCDFNLSGEKTKHTSTTGLFLLPRWDDFRTFRWVDSIKCPELIMKQIEELLATL
jgi:hypothetical protein